MKLYLLVKFIHIISSTILFGTGVGTAMNMVVAHYSRDIRRVADTASYVAISDIYFTGISAVIQVITGFTMVYLAGYSLWNFWIWGALVGYLIAAFCWFPVVYLQLKLRDFALESLQTQSPLPAQYYQYFRLWTCLGIPAFFSLVGVFYLMTVKPG